MTWRYAAAVAAVAPAAVPHQPLIWQVGGYQFEAGSMIAALVSCLMVRWWAAVKDLQHYRLTVDAPVSLLSHLFTAVAVMKLRPEPIYAALVGIGIGTLGAGLMAIGKKYVDTALRALGISPDAQTPL